jgi:hypothetical protein
VLSEQQQTRIARLNEMIVRFRPYDREAVEEMIEAAENGVDEIPQFVYVSSINRDRYFSLLGSVDEVQGEVASLIDSTAPSAPMVCVDLDSDAVYGIELDVKLVADARPYT